MQLPNDIEPRFFDTVYRLDVARWAPAMREVCAAHAVACESIEAFVDGSNLVAAVNGLHVVKMFPPMHRHQWESERRALPLMHGRLPVGVPQLVAAAMRDDGWSYVILSKLDGELLERQWPTMAKSARVGMLRQIGEAMAAAHALPCLEGLAPVWNEFLREQPALNRARFRTQSMPEWLGRDLESFVPRWSSPARYVVLTGEYTPFNLLVQSHRLTGMIDFADAMVGPPEYDLLGPSLFLCEGDADYVDALWAGYGECGRPRDDEARVSLLGLALLHRYANLDRQLRIDEWREQVSSLESLARLVWPAS